MTLCQTDLILTLKYVIVSKWVSSLIWQAYYYKLPKICFCYTFCRPNEKTAQIWCFNLTALFYNIFTNGHFIWEIFDWQFKDLWTYLSAITYLNITKIFHPINKKNLPGKLYATTAPGFWTMPLLILLKMCWLIFLKM